MLDTLDVPVREAGRALAPASASPVKLSGIAVLGSHPATVMQAPFADESWLIYACSPHNIEQRTLPRVTEWFEIHKPIQDKTRSYRYLRALEAMPVVWMRDEENMHLFPGARLYPEKELKERFGPFTFTSSIAFMLAKAIVDAERMSIPQIGLFGIMQASQNEYAYQRPGIQNLIWQATKAGIKVIAPRESCLFDPPKEDF